MKSYKWKQNVMHSLRQESKHVAIQNLCKILVYFQIMNDETYEKLKLINGGKKAQTHTRARDT